MTDFPNLPKGVVSLDTPADCTRQSPGHVPNPVQARLHFEGTEPTIGILEVDDDGVVLISADGTTRLCQHAPDEFLRFATLHRGRQCRYSQAMLSFTDGPTPAISVATPETTSECLPPQPDTR